MIIKNKILLKVIVWILIKSKRNKIGNMIITGFRQNRIQVISKPFTGWYEADSIGIKIPGLRIHF